MATRKESIEASADTRPAKVIVVNRALSSSAMAASPMIAFLAGLGPTKSPLFQPLLT